MKMPNTPVLWLLAAWLVCASSYGHTDVPLKIAEDGSLVADSKDMKVPEKFKPLRYDKENQTIRIGNRSMKLAPYFRSLFPDDGKYKVRFSTSWYHDLALLPPYMLMRIEPEGRQFHYDLLLSLNDLSVIEFSVEVDLGGGASRYFPVDLSHWDKEIKESVTVLKDGSEQVGAGQPATAPESKPEGNPPSKPESEGRPQ